MSLIKLVLDEADIRVMVRKYLVSEECNLLPKDSKEIWQSKPEATLDGSFKVNSYTDPEGYSYQRVNLEVIV